MKKTNPNPGPAGRWWIGSKSGELTRVDQWAELTHAIESESPLVVVRAGGEHAGEIPRLDPMLIREICRRECALALLIPRRSPPRFAYREDAPITSFCCTIGLLRDYVATGNSFAELSVFGLFTAAIARTERSLEIFAVQFPGPVAPALLAVTAERSDWVIPHYGRADLLDVCLASVQQATGGTDCSSVLLAIDGPADATVARLATKYRVGRGYDAAIPRNGPYILRNTLLRMAETEIAFFQDSDDLACTNRAAAICAEFAREPDVGVVGSHEVRLDEVRQEVIPVRYPLDVSRALELGPSHALLHPTSAVRRELFFRSGGFSTFARHSMDTQLLLRSHFYFRTRNVDEFLYVRRWHPGSLCTDETTGLGSLTRAELLVVWGRAFMQSLQTRSVTGTALDVHCGRGAELELQSIPRPGSSARPVIANPAREVAAKS